jgi:hypothetical protein
MISIILLQGLKGGNTMAQMTDNLLLQLIFSKLNKCLKTLLYASKTNIKKLQQTIPYMALIRGDLDIRCSSEIANMEVTSTKLYKNNEHVYI